MPVALSRTAGQQMERVGRVWISVFPDAPEDTGIREGIVRFLLVVEKAEKDLSGAVISVEHRIRTLEQEMVKRRFPLPDLSDTLEESRRESIPTNSN